MHDTLIRLQHITLLVMVPVVVFNFTVAANIARLVSKNHPAELAPEFVHL